MSTKTPNYRISLMYSEIVALSTEFTRIKETSGGLSRWQQAVLTKLNVAIAKIDGDALVASHSSSNEPRSIAGKLVAIDPETWILEHGNPEEKAAVESSLAWMFDNPEETPKAWQEFLPELSDRKYPPSNIPCI